MSCFVVEMSFWFVGVSVLGFEWFWICELSDKRGIDTIFLVCY